MTEHDYSQYCETEIYTEVNSAFDSEDKAKRYINDTLVAELIEEEDSRTCISSKWEDDIHTIEFEDGFTINVYIKEMELE